MKTIQKMLMGLAVLLLVSAPAYAQRAIVSTTLTNAVTATQTTFAIAATTSVAVGQFGFFDREMVQVNAVNTTALTITVQRGVGGTAAAAHAAAEVIFITAGGDYKAVDPDYGAACVRGSGQATVLPWINARTGNIWKCLGTGTSTWNGTNTAPLTYNSIQTGAV